MGDFRWGRKSLSETCTRSSENTAKFWLKEPDTFRPLSNPRTVYSLRADKQQIGPQVSAYYKHSGILQVLAGF